MDAKAFTNPSGKLIRTPQGYEAFLPDPLPREFSLTPEATYLLSSADRSVGELAGMARMLPNPDLIFAPLSRREAVLSSRIEGTQASFSDLAMYEVGGADAPVRNPDVLEVRNYRVALNRGLERLVTLPLSLRFVRELHAELMTDVRRHEKTPGEFRTSQNWIGAPGSSLDSATYVPPPPGELISCLADWEAFLHEQLPVPALVKCAMLHYQFEAIHPFLDGNGRVGRLTILMFLVASGYLSAPVLYLSPYIESHRDEYYSRLRAVTERSDWDGWLKFFLSGVVAQAMDGLERSQEVLNLQQAYRERLVQRRAPNSALRLLDKAFVTPAMTISYVASELDVTWMTARTAISALIEAGILQEVTGRQRDRFFMANEVIQAANRPSRQPVVE